MGSEEELNEASERYQESLNELYNRVKNYNHTPSKKSAYANMQDLHQDEIDTIVDALEAAVEIEDMLRVQEWEERFEALTALKKGLKDGIVPDLVVSVSEAGEYDKTIEVLDETGETVTNQRVLAELEKARH